MAIEWVGINDLMDHCPRQPNLLRYRLDLRALLRAPVETQSTKPLVVNGLEIPFFAETRAPQRFRGRTQARRS